MESRKSLPELFGMPLVRRYLVFACAELSTATAKIARPGGFEDAVGRPSSSITSTQGRQEKKKKREKEEEEERWAPCEARIRGSALQKHVCNLPGQVSAEHL
ncbi:hypothetical protein DBV15_09371 [Temnothorax longispinosus]|uniref:Uncharacterized protein n=1 Tax=Temnothorax longispinosus TaxID=300112 RepID=A0A4S2KFN1_9HYME|nr:hypothetical protein DBV15_09371 [Temnothorax longispinosus]